MDEDENNPPLIAALPQSARGARLDKSLAGALDDPGFSRSRLRALIEDGRVSRIDPAPEVALTDPSAKVKGGEILAVFQPPPDPVAAQAEDIPLSVIYEDAALIVVDKPAGMVVHPAPGAPRGTLVNALLHHCGDTLSGINGEKRPGIVHRIDKDTSGLLVVAKTDAAHQGLAAQFAAHDLERSYTALVWGSPSRADPRMAALPAVTFEPGWVRVETTIGRSRADRKKMAVNVSDGRIAVTRFSVREVLGPVSLIECRLETGRTHQIRVHLTHLGHPLVGDQTYGRSRTAPASLSDGARDALNEFPRQALHAATLGFAHPVSGEEMTFQSPLPDDLGGLLTALGRTGG